jgi:hypothetical protein
MNEQTPHSKAVFRPQWDPFVMAFAHYMEHSLEQIDPGGMDFPSNRPPALSRAANLGRRFPPDKIKMDIEEKVILRTALLIIFFVLVFVPVDSWSHGLAGKRFFPTTFEVDDPFISDEFTFVLNRNEGTDARIIEAEIAFSTRILPKFSFEFLAPYLHEKTVDGDSASGWDNVGAGAKWQFFTNDRHETILSIGTDFDIGGTGSHRSADSFTTISPIFFFGKGLGDLPGSMKFLRPVAVTGAMGPNFPTRRTNSIVNPDTGERGIERNPTTFSWGFTFQYSLMYLQSFVKNIGLGDPLKRMIIIAEFPIQTCMSADCRGNITGTVNPGIIWVGKKIEIGLAAQVPLNSLSGNGVGAFGLIHFFVDDLFPKSLGRPVFR